MALREQSPTTKIIGYQHATVPLSEVGLFPGEGEYEYAPHPDLVLTVGEETAALLKKYGHYHSVPIVPSCAIRYEYLQKLKPRPIQKNRVLLVILFHTVQTQDLYEYVVAELRNHPEWHVIIRPHPSYSIEDLAFESGVTLDLSKFSHIEVSQSASVLADLERAAVVLYWWSSVALEALSLGIPLIAYQDRRLLPHDPLFDCPHLKWTAEPTTALYELLESIIKCPEKEIEKQQELSQSYLKRYFHAVSDDRLNLFLAEDR